METAGPLVLWGFLESLSWAFSPGYENGWTFGP